MDRNLALEFIRVTEASALSAGRQLGRGSEKAADDAAIYAMKKTLDHIDINGIIIIGTEYNESLAVDKKIGTGQDRKIDLAITPLEGRKIIADGGYNATSVLAAGKSNSFLKAPNIYMNKMAVGPKAKGILDINDPVQLNIKRLARTLDKYIEDITVCILNRPRHIELIDEVRKTGCRIRLINDGDVSGAIATCLPNSPVDIMFGIGGAWEGIISAAALKCLGGDFQGSFEYRNDEEKKYTKQGFKKKGEIYSLEELIGRDHVIFCATGVTDGEMLKGIRYTGKGAITNSLVMRSKTRTVRYVEAHHYFEFKPDY